MTLIDRLSRKLLSPPAAGRRAFLYAIVLVAVPTLIRVEVSDFVTGLGFTTYFPFVVLAAIWLNWRFAAAVALASALIADWMFVGRPHHMFEIPADIFGAVILLATSAMMIGLVVAGRTIVENSLRPARPNGIPASVVFSLQDGQAWASWHESHSWVRLGPEEDVAEMMEDFLAQRELGKRLANQSVKDP